MTVSPGEPPVGAGPGAGTLRAGRRRASGPEGATTMADEEIEVRDERAEGRYEAWVGGQRAGLVAYRVHPGLLDLVHTEVAPEFEGRGVGRHLATFVLDDARRRGLRIRPTCPFIAGFIRRNPAYQDLVAGVAGSSADG